METGCWQDISIMVGQFILAGALLPTILNKHKPEPLTSFVTGVVLAYFGLCFATLGGRLSAGAVMFVAVLWFILLVQVLVIKRGRK